MSQWKFLGARRNSSCFYPNVEVENSSENIFVNRNLQLVDLPEAIYQIGSERLDISTSSFKLDLFLSELPTAGPLTIN